MSTIGDRMNDYEPAIRLADCVIDAKVAALPPKARSIGRALPEGDQTVLFEQFAASLPPSAGE